IFYTLAASLNISVQRRNYRGPDIFNIQRRDTEYFTRLALSHNRLSWKGFTPRLNWTWSHIRSNHFYYRYNNHRVFLDIFKQF
ncbi:surface lipoprotein assembly modifier, partial [Neisseria sp. 27098_8_139]|uniref:surface lipoprotein assembly modifier n=1 Tax=Neisseria sp. 27098_8_139 TaxID=3003681 RepID=UPI00352F2849